MTVPLSEHLARALRERRCGRRCGTAMPPNVAVEREGSQLLPCAGRPRRQGPEVRTRARAGSGLRAPDRPGSARRKQGEGTVSQLLDPRRPRVGSDLAAHGGVVALRRCPARRVTDPRRASSVEAGRCSVKSTGLRARARLGLGAGARPEEPRSRGGDGSTSPTQNLPGALDLQVRRGAGMWLGPRSASDAHRSPRRKTGPV